MRDRILRAVEGKPWMLHPAKAAEIAELLAYRATHGNLPEPTAEQEAAAIEAAARRERAGSNDAGGAIAVLNLFGTISKRISGMDAMSGGASLQRFSDQFDAAMDDDAVSKIVVVIDSPGGSVYGVDEMFSKIYAARGKKRVVAVADGLAASAAYYIGVGAEEFVVTPSGEVGSIGVYMVHFDWSENVAAAGVRPTIIKYGDNKAEGNPYETLSEDTREHLLGLVADYGRMFDRAVAKGRGVPVSRVREAFGQGRTFTAKRALDLGMVDRVASLDQVIADERSGRRRRKMAANAEDDLQIAAGFVGGDTVTLDPDEALSALERAASRFAEIATAGAGEVVGGFKVLDGGVDTSMTITAEADEGRSADRETETRPTQPAQQEAKGDTTMSGVKDGAAQPTKDAAAGTIDIAAEREKAVAAERQRQRSLRAIGSEHNIDAKTVETWIDNDVSVETAGGLALQVISDRNRAGADVRVGTDREAERPFESFGHQLRAIMEAEAPGVPIDKRLLRINAAASGASEAVPSDGGFLLDQEYSSEILRRVYSMGEIASRVRRNPIGQNSNGLKLKAIDETSRENGSRWGGVQSYWANEADTVTASKPKFRMMELSLHKLFGLMYATEELLDDVVALQGIAEDAFSEEIMFKVEDAVIRGTGAGQPLGILNASATVSVDGESAQATATINATNVAKMKARLWARSFQNAVWFYNQDTDHQYPLMTIGDQPIYLPPGGFRDTPYAQLLGRPMIPVEYCSTLGTVGDLILADLSQYMMIDKGGTDQMWSIHVRFIYDEQTFRITYRCDGQPLWNQALTPYQGTNTQSPFITLATRS